MAAGRNVPIATLQQWAGNFANNQNLKLLTNHATVSLAQLEEYIKEVKEKYAPAIPAGFKISLIRYSLPGGQDIPGKVKHVGNNVSQLSLVMVPLGNYDPAKGAKKDDAQVLPNPGDAYVLSFSDPGDTTTTDSTALCPPKCGT